MVTASANYESVGIIEESTFGTNPGGTKQLLNFTNCNLKAVNEEKNSAFVRSDTNVAGTVRTGRSVSGSIGIEWQYGGYDMLLEAVLRSGDWGSTLTETATDISAAASDNSFNSAGGSFPAFVAGQWVKVSGFTGTSTNNGYFYVVSATSSKIIVSGGNGALVDDAAGESVTIKGTMISNGTTEKSFTIERHKSDISAYNLLTGQRVSDFSLNFATQDIANGSVSFIGAQGVASGSSGFSGSTAAATTLSMNTVTDLAAIFVNKTLSTNSFTGLDLTISTNSEALNRIGSEVATDINQGSIGVSGNFSMFKESTTFEGYVDNFTAFDLAFVTEDEAGNGYIFHLPTIRINGGADNEGINSVISDNFSFNATLNAALGRTISVTRFAA